MSTGIGEALRAARRQQGRSLADAAAATRVRESYLAALEDEEFSALGGDVYVKGFLRSYARFLGLNPEPLLENFRREHERPEEANALSMAGHPMDLDRRRGLSPMAVAATIALAIMALYVVFNRGGDELPPAAPAPVSSTIDDANAGAGLDDGERLDPNAPAEEPVDDADEGSADTSE